MNQAPGSFQLSSLLSLLPDAFAPILVTFALSFLIGLEREEHAGSTHYNFGGVRTFPIIGICGYLMASLSAGSPLLLGVGALVFGSLFWLSYRKKLEQSSLAGITTEASALFTYLLGAMLFRGALWEATALAVMVLLLLELKLGLEAMARKIPAGDVFTFTRFLLISAVILPIVPNREFTELHFNPFHTWLIVVAISGLSYGAYVVERLRGPGSSLLMTAVLGGIYSSTSTTVVLAKRSATDPGNRMYPGAILLASGLMYIRLLVLLLIFNAELFRTLLVPFAIMGVTGFLAGTVWMRLNRTTKSAPASAEPPVRNPLELKSALLFAVLFSVMGILTAFTLRTLGSGGMFGLSFVTGLTDVDPFVMSLTQSAGSLVAMNLAAKGILIATASNNLMKGFYAAMAGAGDVRRLGAGSLVALGALSLIGLFFL